MAPYIRDKKALIGALLVIAGILLILDNLKFVPDFMPWWIFTWQFLLIAIGVISLLTSEKTTPGFVLIFIGAFFLFPDILRDVWPGLYDILDTNNLFWYLLLIVIGISLILNRHHSSRYHDSRYRDRAMRYKRRWEHRYPNNDGGSSSAETETNKENNEETTYDVDDYIDQVSIFGGGEKVMTSKNFKGGKITCIFGGCEIDLTQASLAPGIHEIEVLTLFGGWTLITPPTWKVKNEATTLFGGFSDSRKLNVDAVRDNTRQLVIRGVVLFGGGELKTY